MHSILELETGMENYEICKINKSFKINEDILV